MLKLVSKQALAWLSYYLQLLCYENSPIYIIFNWIDAKQLNTSFNFIELSFGKTETGSRSLLLLTLTVTLTAKHSDS